MDELFCKHCNIRFPNFGSRDLHLRTHNANNAVPFNPNANHLQDYSQPQHQHQVYSPQYHQQQPIPSFINGSKEQFNSQATQTGQLHLGFQMAPEYQLQHEPPQQYQHQPQHHPRPQPRQQQQQQHQLHQQQQHQQQQQQRPTKQQQFQNDDPTKYQLFNPQDNLQHTSNQPPATHPYNTEHYSQPNRTRIPVSGVTDDILYTNQNNAAAQQSQMRAGTIFPNNTCEVNESLDVIKAKVTLIVQKQIVDHHNNNNSDDNATVTYIDKNGEELLLFMQRTELNELVDVFTCSDAILEMGQHCGKLKFENEVTISVCSFHIDSPTPEPQLIYLMPDYAHDESQKRRNEKDIFPDEQSENFFNPPPTIKVSSSSTLLHQRDRYAAGDSTHINVQQHASGPNQSLQHKLNESELRFAACQEEIAALKAEFQDALQSKHGLTNDMKDKEESIDRQLEICSAQRESIRQLHEELEALKVKHDKLNEQNDENIKLVSEMTSSHNKSGQEMATDELKLQLNQAAHKNEELGLALQRVTNAYHDAMREKQKAEEFISSNNTTEIGIYYSNLLTTRTEELNKLRDEYDKLMQQKILQEANEKLLFNKTGALQKELVKTKEELTSARQLLHNTSAAVMQEGYERALSPSKQPPLDNMVLEFRKMANSNDEGFVNLPSDSQIRHHNENLIKEVSELKSQLDKYSESYSDLYSKHSDIIAYSTQLETKIKQMQMKMNSTPPGSAVVHNNTEHRIISQPTANTGANYAPINSGNYVPQLRPDSYYYTVAMFLQDKKEAILSYNISHLVDPNLHIGQMVLCKFKKSNKYYVYGILRCIFANRREMNILMAGIDLFDQVGNSNGLYDGIQYFRVNDKHAIFLPLEEVLAPKQN